MAHLGLTQKYKSIMEMVTRMPLLENTTALLGTQLAVSYILILGIAHGHLHMAEMEDME